MRDAAGKLGAAAWVSGPAYDYGADDAGYYATEDEALRTHLVSTTFEVKPEELAGAPFELALAVLGLARVKVNGCALPVELLGHWTRYDKTVYFDVFDVSALVREGSNTLAIELGNGFYNPAPLTLFGKYNLRERLAEVGAPAVAAVLARDGEVLVRTDESWRLSRGMLLFNNMYLGEVCDLTYEQADEGPVAVRGRGCDRVLAPAPVPPIRRTGSVAPVRTVATPDGVLVDFGEMVSGTVDMAFAASEGDRVELVYAEVAENDRIRTDSNVAGLVGKATPRGVCPGGPGAPSPAIQHDVLLCRAGENAYASTFTYHSFRYVLIKGLEKNALTRIEAVYVHTDVARTGEISCGNADFDRLMDAAARTKLNNVHDVWEDCSRERFGYGGDMVSLMNSNLLLFDEEGLLDRTLGDFARDQTERGGLPETAPFMGIGSNGPAYREGPLLWQLAYPYLAVQADRYYGRRDLIEREWPGLTRFGDYLLSFDPAELAEHCLGDHGSILTDESAGFGTCTPDKEFLGWCAQLWNLVCLAEAGERAGRDGSRFAEAAERLRGEIRARFAHEDGSFGDGTQSACAFAGALGLGDASLQAELLVADFRARDGILTTGIFGTMLAFDLLDRTGHNDVVEAWLTRTEHPSLLDMLASGNGALAEQFTESLSSFNHAMFTSYAQWFMQALGGIRIADDAVAANRVVVNPYFSSATDAVSCSYQTPHGRVAVRWRRMADGIEVAVMVPEGIELDMTNLATRAGVSVVREA